MYIQQGFYDLKVSKHLSKEEGDFVRLIGECNKFDHELTRLAEFDTKIAHVRNWVQGQTRLVIVNLLQIPKDAESLQEL